MTSAVQAVAAPTPARPANPPGRLRAVGVLAAREMLDAVRNRWFLLYAAAFAVLALGLSLLTTAGASYVGLGGFGRTTASLVNLVMLIVPLMGLSAGANLIAPDEERGTLAYLLAQPIGRGELLAGKLVGQALALAAALALGFGVAAVTMAWRGTAGSPRVFLTLVALAWVLAVTMLSVGAVVSTVARRGAVAQGVGLLLWLVFVFLGDIGLMGSALLLRLRAWQLLHAAIVNPLYAFKLLVLRGLGTKLDVLGPAGLFAVRRYGEALPWMLAGILAAWVVLPAVLAWLVLRRRSIA